jgi:hypothetical protein
MLVEQPRLIEMAPQSVDALLRRTPTPALVASAYQNATTDVPKQLAETKDWTPLENGRDYRQPRQGRLLLKP